jgi:hypothetical protein
MDADLTALYAAATTIGDKLAILNSQTMRDQLAASRATNDSLVALTQTMLSQFNSADELRREIAVSIAANYMKPSTATLPESQLADATRDAAFLKVALDEAVKAV